MMVRSLIMLSINLRSLERLCALQLRYPRENMSSFVTLMMQFTSLRLLDAVAVASDALPMLVYFLQVCGLSGVFVATEEHLRQEEDVF